jgi:sorbitol/mannitol transport system permease protein
MLPPHDVNLACRELLRCVQEMGAVGSFLRPNLVNGHYWHSNYWDPLYSLHESLDVTWGFHEGTGAWYSHMNVLYGENRFYRHVASHWIEMQQALIAMLIGIGLALILDRKFLGRGIVRTLLITPFLIMPVVAGLIWKNQMFSKLFGVVNWGLERLSLDSIAFVSNHPTFSIVTVLVWQWTPFMMLIVLAGLQSQPEDVLEAAKVDGATAFGTFRQLTLPHLRRYLELGALLGTIYLIQVFDHIDVMTGGGPGSTNIPRFVYERSIGGGWLFGQASAYSIVVVVASIIVATGALRVLSTLFRGEEAA